MFYDREYSNYINLGKSIVTELKLMDINDLEQIKTNLNNVFKKPLEKVINYVDGNYLVSVSVLEPLLSIGIQWIFIMDMDLHTLIIKSTSKTESINFNDIKKLC